MWSDLRIRVVLVLGFAATTISGRDNGPMRSGLQMERKELETVWEPFLASNHCSCILLESSAQIWLGDSEWYGHRMIFEREDGTRLQGSFLYHLENPSQDGTWENVRLFTLKRKFYWHSETGWTCDRQQVGRQLTIQEWFMIPTLNIEPGRPWTEQPVREGYLKPITNVSSLRWNELRELLEGAPTVSPVAEDQDGEATEDASSYLAALKSRLSAHCTEALEDRVLALIRKCSWENRSENCIERSVGDFFRLPLPETDARPILEVLGPEPSYRSVYVVRRPSFDRPFVQAEIRVGCDRLTVCFFGPTVVDCAFHSDPLAGSLPGCEGNMHTSFGWRSRWESLFSSPCSETRFPVSTRLPSVDQTTLPFGWVAPSIHAFRNEENDSAFLFF